MVLSTFPTTLFDFPDHVISYSLTSLLLMFGFTAKENSVKVNKISEVCLHWTDFWGTNVSLHSCLWSFFFFHCPRWATGALWVALEWIGCKRGSVGSVITSKSRWKRLLSALDGTYLDFLFWTSWAPDECWVWGCKPPLESWRPP